MTRQRIKRKQAHPADRSFGLPGAFLSLCVGNSLGSAGRKDAFEKAKTKGLCQAKASQKIRKTYQHTAVKMALCASFVHAVGRSKRRFRSKKSVSGRISAYRCKSFVDNPLVRLIFAMGYGTIYNDILWEIVSFENLPQRIDST